jgi:bifunctional DNase/RNase
VRSRAIYRASSRSTGRIKRDKSRGYAPRTFLLLDVTIHSKGDNISMIPVSVEGVRRNFGISSVFMYSVSLLDEAGKRLLLLHVERHEAWPIIAALNHVTLPRQETINVMVDTLKSLNCTLEEVRIESYSINLPSLYNLCSCVLRWRTGEGAPAQAMTLRPGDAVGLALLTQAPLLISEELFKQMGIPLAEGETPELVFARYLLRQEGITLPEGKKLRLGYSRTPLRDALVKEFKASLLGKAPPFPEEDMEQRKKDYLAFLLGEDATRLVYGASDR